MTQNFIFTRFGLRLPTEDAAATVPETPQVFCLCNQPAAMRTSNSPANPGRDYYACNVEDKAGKFGRRCKYFKWVDELNQSRATSSSTTGIGAQVDLAVPVVPTLTFDTSNLLNYSVSPKPIVEEVRKRLLDKQLFCHVTHTSSHQRTMLHMDLIASRDPNRFSNEFIKVHGPTALIYGVSHMESTWQYTSTLIPRHGPEENNGEFTQAPTVTAVVLPLRPDREDPALENAFLMVSRQDLCAYLDKNPGKPVSLPETASPHLKVELHHLAHLVEVLGPKGRFF